MPPTPSRQAPPKLVQAAKPAAASPLVGDILSCGQNGAQMAAVDYVSLALYGRNRAGKSTFACQAKKPLAHIAIDPSLTGGTRSLTKIPGVTFFQVSNRPLIDPVTKLPETLWGSAKVMAIIQALTDRFDRGERPFETVVLDGVTSWNDIILQEIMGIDAANVKGIIGFGDAGQDQYRDRAERLIRYLRPLFALPCNVTVIAQEKDHNPPKDDKGRVMGTKLIRPKQEDSWFSLAIGDSPCLWIQNACDFVCQLYEDEEIKTELVAMMEGMPPEEVQTRTGKAVRHLRMRYHPNYAAGPRSPDAESVPESIVGGTPAEMHAAFMEVVAGKKTARGKY